MEFIFNKNKDAQGKDVNTVYMKGTEVVFIAKISDKIYAPNFSLVCFTNAEMANIKALVTDVKANGTQRITRNGRVAMDGGNDKYDVSIISLENGKLVDVSFKDPNSEFYALSIKWIEQTNGTTQLTVDANFTYFSPSGKASFDLGFKRMKVKQGKNVYDEVGKKFITTYDDKETFITAPSQATAEGFLRAYKGMKLLESAIEFAGKHMTPVQDAGSMDGIDNSLIGSIPM